MTLCAQPVAPRLVLLATPGFLAAMAVMLLNDLVLKAAFHDALTGKLSDFSGVFAFCLFLITCLPRHPHLCCVVGALLFAWWKAPFSAPVIAAWNELGWWPVARVQDWTDILAVSMAPLAWVYARNARPLPVRPAARVILGICTALIFSAQNPRGPKDEFFVADLVYVVPGTVEELRRQALAAIEHASWGRDGDDWRLWVQLVDGQRSLSAIFAVHETQGVAELHLTGFAVWRVGADGRRLDTVFREDEREGERRACLVLIQDRLMVPIGAHAVQGVTAGSSSPAPRSDR